MCQTGLKTVDGLVEQRPERFGGDITAGQAGASGGDHRIDLGIGHPGLGLRLDVFLYCP